MERQELAIKPVRPWDLPLMTRMAYANMTGVDVEFTRFARNPLLRALGYFILPLYLLTSGRGFKAVVGDETVGCAYLHLRRLSGLAFNVHVNRSHRRQGIGRALMEHLESVTRSRGLPWIGLQVDEGNRPAQQLYHSLDYRPFHPHYLYHEQGPMPIPRAAPGIVLELLTRGEGRRLYRRYARLEREAGDAWAARVVETDFDEGPPSGGRTWRCLWKQQEVGCLSLDHGRQGPVATLLLRPHHWGQTMLTYGLLRQLLKQLDGAPTRLSLYLGSSGHHRTALPIFRELNFRTRRRPRILMLKQLRQSS
ncbi:MAG: GNAT family N-acetyltransferase [Candidatus Promineifilaceae bacterium]|nr:GNAT family N-acetyltransferase [Candidatus Promineifilaceae bacterium]